MKNILFFCILLLFAACSKKTEIVPEVVPNPTLNLTLSADSVRPGESVVITCATENAVRTSNNFGAPTTTQWTHTLTPAQTTTLEVTAFNDTDKSITKTLVVSFFPWTRVDTLCDPGRYWQIRLVTASLGQNTDTVNLNQDQKTDQWFFYPDSTFKVIHENGATPANGTAYFKGNQFQFGNQILNYTLTDIEFVTYQTYSGILMRTYRWREPKN